MWDSWTSRPRELTVDDIVETWNKAFTFEETIADQVWFFRHAESTLWSCALDALLLR